MLIPQLAILDLCGHTISTSSITAEYFSPTRHLMVTYKAARFNIALPASTGLEEVALVICINSTIEMLSLF